MGREVTSYSGSVRRGSVRSDNQKFGRSGQARSGKRSYSFSRMACTSTLGSSHSGHAHL